MSAKATRERLRYLAKVAEDIIETIDMIEETDEDLDPWSVDDGSLMYNLHKLIGKYNFACEMLMYGGDLSVEEIAVEQMRVAIMIQADSSLKHQPLAMLSQISKGYNYLIEKGEE